MGVRSWIERRGSTVSPSDLEYSLLAAGWRTTVEVLPFSPERDGLSDPHLFRVSLIAPNGLQYWAVATVRHVALHLAAMRADFI